MINRITDKSAILVSVTPASDGSRELNFITLDGTKVCASGKVLPANTSIPLRAAIFSLDSYFEQTELAATSDKMLALLARRHLDNELIFQDDAYRLRALPMARHERSISANIAAMPEHDIDAAMALVPADKQPCLQLVPVELAIAALVGRFSPGATLVFWEKGGILLSLLVTAGAVCNRMCERVSESNRVAAISRAESGLKAGIEQTGEDAAEILSIFTGDLCGAPEELREKPELDLERTINASFRIKDRQQTAEVLQSPELYGLPFVPDDWSFMAAGYRTQVNAWRFAKPAAMLASAAGIVIALLGGITHLQAIGTANDFQLSKGKLQNLLAETAANRPSDAQIEAVRNALRVEAMSHDEVRIDRFLAWLTNTVPSGVVIRDLTVLPTPAPRSRYGNAQENYPQGQKPFTVNLELMFADTSFNAAESGSAEVVRRLSRRLQMLDTRLEIPAPEPGQPRKVVLAITAQAKAENFRT
jgi:hypothetical protein